MYTLQDRNDEILVLRPEGTAGVVRAILNNGLHQDMPARFSYFGAMFRYERPQKGRLRQFHQVGVEHFGDPSPNADIESLALSYAYLRAIGANFGAELQINTLGDMDSRHAFREDLVNYLTPFKNELSDDSQRRLLSNPLRILDSKDHADQKLLQNAPNLHDHLTQSAKEHFDAVCCGLNDLNIDFTVNNKIVRGLDYYVHTTFEWVHGDLGSQSTILAGGRYDGLSSQMGGVDLPGVGWAAGVERLMLATQFNTNTTNQIPSVIILPLTPNEQRYARMIATQTRFIGMPTQVWGDGSIKKRLKKSITRDSDFVIIIDSDNVTNETIVIKDMKKSTQVIYSISEGIQALQKHQCNA